MGGTARCGDSRSVPSFLAPSRPRAASTSPRYFFCDDSLLSCRLRLSFLAPFDWFLGWLGEISGILVGLLGGSGLLAYPARTWFAAMAGFLWGEYQFGRIMMLVSCIFRKNVKGNLMNQYDPRKHHRRSIRLKGWDYRAPAYYFVTICTYKWQPLFENQDFYDIAANAFRRVPQQAHAQHVELDEWMVMPTHAHVIFHFINYPPQADMSQSQGMLQNGLAGSLGVVVGRYKTAVSTRINKLRHSAGAKVWLRGYYERIVRDEKVLHATRQYTRNNPIRWEEDRGNLNTLLSKMTYHS